jgi:hypothetical protein
MISWGWTWINSKIWQSLMGDGWGNELRKFEANAIPSGKVMVTTAVDRLHVREQSLHTMYIAQQQYYSVG